MDIFYGLLLSAHVGLSGQYNEIHPHAGFYIDENKEYSIGSFLNSESNLSTYLSYRYQYSDKISADVGLVTGYSTAEVLPMIRINYNNFFIAPVAEEYMNEFNTGIVLGFEWRNK